jgi:Flp pilus assembly protein TadG
MLMRPGRRGRDRGAAAVEFALVMPVLFMLLMGIIDYGLWFNDSLSVRQGVREAARQAVVLVPLGGTDPNTGAACGITTSMADVACGTRSRIVTAGGMAYARVFTRSGGWARADELVVCGMVHATSFTGFVPLPAGGLIKSRTSMSIESVPTTLPSPTSYTLDLPDGDWTWCTAP